MPARRLGSGRIRGSILPRLQPSRADGFGATTRSPRTGGGLGEPDPPMRPVQGRKASGGRSTSRAFRGRIRPRDQEARTTCLHVQVPVAVSPTKPQRRGGRLTRRSEERRVGKEERYER